MIGSKAQGGGTLGLKTGGGIEGGVINKGMDRDVSSYNEVID